MSNDNHVETPRQRYIRNHQENINLMKMSLERHRSEGMSDEDLFRVEQIIAAWEHIGERAIESEEQDRLKGYDDHAQR